jgi:glycosyltransferase involved in cell wall biosynthesis
MKIGFDAKRAFQNSTGLGNYSRNTLNALIMFYPDEEYVLFTPEIKTELFGGYRRFKIVAPQNFVAKKLKSFWRSLFLIPHLKKHQVEVFHGLSNELPNGIENSGIPSVVTIHDLVFMRYPEFYQAIDRKIYFKKTRYACKAADKIIAISRQTRNDIVTFFQVPEEKIETIYQPVAPVFFDKHEPLAALEKYNLPKEYILSVGTLEPRKNQLSLLKALKTSEIKIPLVFVGKATTYTAEMKRYIAENLAGQQVVFLTNIPEKDLAALYQGALLSVYISVFEGFGLPVIESMACGCPVVTSTVSVLPETAGKAALLCNPADIEDIGSKILMLMKDSTLKSELIKKGIKRARQFHPELYADKLHELYTNILKEKNA